MTGIFDDATGRDRVPLPIGGFWIRRGPAEISETEIIWDRVSFPPTPYNLGSFALLREFLALARGTPQDFLRFARRYGPLNGLYPRGGEREGLLVWHRCIEIANGILTIATRLRNGELTNEDDWAPLPVVDMPCAKVPSSINLAWQKLVLTQTIHEMVVKWGVFPRVNFAESDPRLELGGERLLSGIAAQLVCAVCKTDGFVFCTNCGGLFTPDRKPRSGNHFCKPCRLKGAKGKHAQRKFRELKSSEKEAAV